MGGEACNENHNSPSYTTAGTASGLGRCSDGRQVHGITDGGCRWRLAESCVQNMGFTQGYPFLGVPSRGFYSIWGINGVPLVLKDHIAKLTPNCPAMRSMSCLKVHGLL